MPLAYVRPAGVSGPLPVVLTYRRCSGRNTGDLLRQTVLLADRHPGRELENWGDPQLGHVQLGRREDAWSEPNGMVDLEQEDPEDVVREHLDEESVIE